MVVHSQYRQLSGAIVRHRLRTNPLDARVVHAQSDGPCLLRCITPTPSRPCDVSAPGCARAHAVAPTRTTASARCTCRLANSAPASAERCGDQVFHRAQRGTSWTRLFSRRLPPRQLMQALRSDTLVPPTCRALRRSRPAEAVPTAHGLDRDAGCGSGQEAAALQRASLQTNLLVVG
jgi:hypothetical protein